MLDRCSEIDISPSKCDPVDSSSSMDNTNNKNNNSPHREEKRREVAISRSKRKLGRRSA